MKRTSIIAASLLFTLFIACKSEGEKSSDNTVPAINPEAQSVPAANNPFITPGNDSLQKASGDLALNPQHGQPGHRCDIAVGAPLNSPVGNNAVQQPAITTTIPPVNNTAIPPANNTAPINITPPITGSASSNLNPQHGQPGHRCDIAVGAPLDGKPKQ